MSRWKKNTWNYFLKPLIVTDRRQLDFLDYSCQGISWRVPSHTAATTMEARLPSNSNWIPCTCDILGENNRKHATGSCKVATEQIWTNLDQMPWNSTSFGCCNPVSLGHLFFPTGARLLSYTPIAGSGPNSAAGKLRSLKLKVWDVTKGSRG